MCQLVNTSVVTHQLVNLGPNKSREYDRLFSVQAAMTTSPITSKGDCGGIIVLFDNNYINKIIGMHVMGSSDLAYSAILTKQMIDSMKGDYKCKTPTVIEESFCHEQVDYQYSSYPVIDLLDQVKEEIVDGKSKNMPDGQFEYIGEIPYLSKLAAKTALTKHPFHGIFDVTGAPAAFRVEDVDESKLCELDVDENGEYNLATTRIKKYGKNFKNKVDPEVLSDMKSDMIDYYGELMGHLDLSASNIDEVLNGKEGDDCSHPLDLRTSAGLPWSGVEEHRSFKKDHYFDTVSVVNSYNNLVIKRQYADNAEANKLKSVIEETEKLAKSKVRTLSLVKCCLKDETRPLDKVHKPRVFMAFPLDKVILARKYFLKFKTEWTKLGLKMQHGVGINVTSPQWTALYHHMMSKGNEACDADFGTFDGNLRRDFMLVAFDVIVTTIINAMRGSGLYSEQDLTEHANILYVLLDENLATICVAGKTVFGDEHGNPSGSVLTTVLNCIVNVLYHWYCFRKITGYTAFSKFLDTISIVCFGDDIIYTANRELGYTFEAVADIMINELEQDYTDAGKTEHGAVKPITEVSFLKRKFNVISPLIVLSPIEKESIEGQFNWTCINPSDYETHYQNIYEAFLEASQHGPEYFAHFRAGIRKGIRLSSFKHNRRFSGLNPSYSDCRKDLLQRYENA